jgi:dTDP-4-dehydrorhamnose reductase
VSVDILLTGANGQLGWEIERRAAAHGLSLQALKRSDLDIADRGRVAEAVDRARPKIVINGAAYTAVDKAETEHTAAFAANRDGPANLAQACLRHDAVLIHLSTDYVYDGTKRAAYLETDSVGPISVYGASKLAGEDAVRHSGARHVILRTAWVHGVHGHNFVKTMLRLARDRSLLRVVDDQRGCPTFAGDLSEAVLATAARLMRAPQLDELFGTFHCVGGGETTWCGFATAIVAAASEKLGVTPRVEAITTAEYPTPARRPANSVLDCGKLARVYGIRLRPWEDGLNEMLSRFLAGEGA